MTQEVEPKGKVRTQKPKGKLPKVEEQPILFSYINPKGLKLIMKLTKISGERERYRMLLRSLGQPIPISVKVTVKERVEGEVPNSDNRFIPAWKCGISIAEGTKKTFATAKEANAEGKRILLQIAKKFEFRVDGETIYA
jgi:hypothetical protein